MDSFNHPTTAAALLRVGAVFLILTALWQLLGNIADSVFAVDPSYLGHYFQQNLLRPLIGLVLGICLFLFAEPVARRCAPPNRENP